MTVHVVVETSDAALDVSPDKKPGDWIEIIGTASAPWERGET